MSWEEVRRDRQHRRGSRASRHRRHAEWMCNTCEKANYLTNNTCRECHAPRQGNEYIWPAATAQHVQPQQQQQQLLVPPKAMPGTYRPPGTAAFPPLPPGPSAAAAAGNERVRESTGSEGERSASRTWDRSATPWANRSPLSYAERAKKLGEQADALESLGVGGDAVAQIRKEAEEAWEEHAQTKPRKAKLRDARKRLRDAERKLTTAAEQITAALADHTAAEAEAHAARQELEELKVTAEPPCKQNTAVVTLMCAAQKTLEWLEAHSFGPPGAEPPPSSLIEQMQDLRGATTELCAELGLDAGTLAAKAGPDCTENAEEDEEEEEDEMKDEPPGDGHSPSRPEGTSEEEKPKRQRTESPEAPEQQTASAASSSAIAAPVPFAAPAPVSPAPSSSPLTPAQRKAAERIATRSAPY